MLHTTSDRRLPTITDNQRGWSGGIDPIVQTFVSSSFANITDVVQISALNYLVTALKENGLWNRILLFYPFVGGNATSHRFNLVNPNLYAITFTGAFVHDSNGVAGTASSNATAATGFPDSATDVTNMAFGYYGTYVNTNQITLGNTTFASGPTYIWAGNSVRLGGGTTTAFSTSVLGFHCVSNVSGINAQFFRNQFNQVNFSRSSTTSTNWVIQLSSTGFATFNRMKMAFVSGAFDATEIVLFNTIVNVYQELLGRSDYTINPDFDIVTNRYLNVVGFANVSLPQQYGLDYLITNLRPTTIWSKLLYLFPVVGTTAATQTRDVIQLATATLSGPFSHTSLGIDPQATTSFFTPSLINWSVIGYTQGHVAIYINEQNTQNGFDMTGTTNRLLVQATNGSAAVVGAFGGTNASVANTNTLGFWLVDIGGLSTAGALYRNGSSVVTYTAGANNNSNIPYFFALPTGTSGSLRRGALMSWGATRLTPTEISTYSSIVQEYQNLLNRS